MEVRTFMWGARRTYDLSVQCESAMVQKRHNVLTKLQRVDLYELRSVRGAGLDSCVGISDVSVVGPVGRMCGVCEVIRARRGGLSNQSLDVCSCACVFACHLASPTVRNHGSVDVV